MLLLVDFITHGSKRLKGQSDEQRRAITKRTVEINARTLRGSLFGNIMLVIGLTMAIYLVTGWVVSGVLGVNDEPNGIIALFLVLVFLAAPILSVWAALWLHRARVRGMIERGIGRLACPRCEYSLVSIPVFGECVRCPECGLMCDKRALGIDTREIDEQARTRRLTLIERATLVLYGGCVRGLEPRQKLGVLRAAKKIKARRSRLGVIKVILAVAGAIICVQLVLMAAAVFARFDFSRWLHPWMLFTLVLFGIFLFERERLRGLIRRFLPRPICLNCCSIRFTGDIVDQCIACADCLKVNSIYEMGLRVERIEASEGEACDGPSGLDADKGADRR